jgi:hypothetical protein
MAEKLSENFTLEEFTYSETAKARGISNKPSTFHKKILKHTCQYLLEPLRKLLNEKYKEYKKKKVKEVGIRITSGYRSPALNAAIGGATNSQHVKGEACDVEVVITFADGKKEVLPFNVLYEDIKAWVKNKDLNVDQCIQEQSGLAKWIHISLPQQIRDCRKQFLKYNKGMYSMDCILK